MLNYYSKNLVIFTYNLNTAINVIVDIFLLFIIISYFDLNLELLHVQWRARNFAHIGHFTGIILLK
jgi:hypothetical protein